MGQDIVIVDYGRGNLRSVQKGLEKVGAPSRIASSPEDLKAPGMILPGVGAFRDAMNSLLDKNLVPPIIEHIRAGKPFLGICLGLHLLFSEGEEFGVHRGLDVIPGRVVRFAEGKKIPHIGWNTITIVKDTPLLKGIENNSYFYFVHSYYARPEQDGCVEATTEYGEVFPSVISRDRLFATQFHPEKSQRFGLKVLENFAALTREEQP